ncbi:MAG TPA: ABC transporter ATP-binding protein [Candidatus Angelobacter sp.]
MEDQVGNKRIASRQLLRLAQPYWPHLTAIFLLSLIAAPIALLLAFPLKIAVDNVIGSRPLPHVLQALLPAVVHGSKAANLMLAVALLLFLSLAMNLQSFASWLLQTYTGEKLVLDFRAQLFWHVQRMDLLFHDRRGANDVAYRIQHDAPAIQYIFLQGAAPLVSAGLSFAALLYVMLRLDWKLAVIALSISPVLFLLARRSSRHARSGWDGIKKLDSSAMLVLHEALASIRVVKAFAREPFEDQRFGLRSRQRMQEQVKVASRLAGFHVLITTTVAVGSAAGLWVGVRHVQAGRLTLGDLLLAMAYMAQLYDPLRTISAKLPELQGWMVSVERALALLQGPPEIKDAPELSDGKHALPVASPERAQGRIRFRDVSFAYPTSGRALDGVSFEIAPGTRVGIIGPSGSGKSTLVNLLTRFYDPLSGQALLDGRDLRDYPLADLRRQFSIILQEPVVFSASVAENIAYGHPGAGRQEIMDAARSAMAHDFIVALPEGYDTKTGEGGCRLSGGERQRLGIARAFLKDAPVLILDEPTSAVDIHTEHEIMQAAQSLIRGRTTFVIAHRLSTVRDCDLILALNQGRLVAATPDLQEALRAIDDPPVAVTSGDRHMAAAD